VQAGSADQEPRLFCFIFHNYYFYAFVFVKPCACGPLVKIVPQPLRSQLDIGCHTLYQKLGALTRQRRAIALTFFPHHVWPVLIEALDLDMCVYAGKIPLWEMLTSTG
jgi:hypothetical protein